jgi:hypothetical protein
MLPLEDSAEIADGWTGDLEVQAWVGDGWTDDSEVQEPIPKWTSPRNQFNIICGQKFNRAEAGSLLEDLQFMYGTMSMSLESIEEFKLTEPLAVNGSNGYAGRGELYENGRIWRAMASIGTNPQLKSVIRAKQAVASGHVILHESFRLWGDRVPLSYGSSLWSEVRSAPESFYFRNCRNFFSHEFLRTQLGNDLYYYKQVEEMYTSTVPVLEVLIEKLQLGLADDNAWKTEESELSYSDRPKYGMDTPEAEANEAEERTRIITSELPVEEETGESLPESPEDPTAVDSITAWLEETQGWNHCYEITRRQSWSHFFVDTYGQSWM